MLGLGCLDTGAFGNLDAPIVPLALLEVRAWALPVCAVSEGRDALPLAPEEAVCAMSDGGKLTGFVGDLTLGLTNPVPLELGLRGAGFFVAEDDVTFVVVDDVGFVAIEVVSFFGAVRAVVRAVALGAVVLVADVGVLTVAGDFAGTVALIVGFVEIALGRTVVFFVAVEAADFEGAEAASVVFGFPLTVLVGTAVAVVGSPGRRDLEGCSSSICLSGLTLGWSVTAPMF